MSTLRLAYFKGMDLSDPNKEWWQLESHGMLTRRFFDTRAEGEAYIASRTLTEARRLQGFKSQAHLDAFFALYDHTQRCPECQQEGEGTPTEDGGWQPTMKRCAYAQSLDLKRSEAGK